MSWRWPSALQHTTTCPAGQKDISKAVAQAVASMPPCKSYTKAVGDFVANFAGGESVALLKYLDHIGAFAAFMKSKSI